MGELTVDLDGFEGPISLLLALAREQKVDLKRISILALAEQYLAFIAAAHRLRLEIAADYLVMAAWLAYLKSRLLLPDPPPGDEPTGAELAEALAFRLARLEAMQGAAEALFRRDLLGREVFGRGAADEQPPAAAAVYGAGLYDLLKAYAALQARNEPRVLRIRSPDYYSVDDALQRLIGLIGGAIDWRQLVSFLPPSLRGAAPGRSGLAATFAASLELAKAGRIELRQDRAFGPIWLRASRPQG